MKPLAKPFIKWAGGKSQILSEIRKNYPEGFGKDITKYAEPFVGGGAVLFDILCNYSMEAVYISDINNSLIDTYLTIRDDLHNLIDLLTELQFKYYQADTEGKKAFYYNIRNQYNELQINRSEKLRIAAFFIFLNHTCFNGLYRVNSKGEFNVPMGQYKKSVICDIENLQAVSSCLQGVQIICGDYHLSNSFIDNKTFVYFDPPYRPLSQTSSFTAYSQNGFGDKEQAELAKFINDMTRKGAYIVASNSDPKNTNVNDDFFDVLYSKHKIFRINANRMINSSADGRGKITELLIVNK